MIEIIRFLSPVIETNEFQQLKLVFQKTNIIISRLENCE